ncbi:MAG TPA: hypothetical protein VG329_00520 [Candidatus Dormibacteraeota bacterium]|jgi:hypothetical protein|nr:hypothetical protein [Candidatus Dormibacteraeota bacterium]
MRERWEALETWQRATIAFPPLMAFLFLLNLGPFSQPLGSSIIYGVIEGALFTGLLLVATNTELNRRRAPAAGQTSGADEKARVADHEIEPQADADPSQGAEDEGQ